MTFCQQTKNDSVYVVFFVSELKVILEVKVSSRTVDNTNCCEELVVDLRSQTVEGENTLLILF